MVAIECGYDDSALNNIIEKYVGLSVDEIRRMTPDEKALHTRSTNGYGTSITVTNTRGINGRGSMLAALGKVTFASEAKRRFARLLD